MVGIFLLNYQVNDQIIFRDVSHLMLQMSSTPSFLLLQAFLAINV